MSSKQTARFVRRSEQLQKALRLVPFFVLLLLGAMVASGCLPTSVKSDDPVLAAQQEWIAGCLVADRQIQTATVLYQAGQIPESVASHIDEAVALYAAVCAVDPPDAGAPIASVFVRSLAARVCPSMAPPGPSEDWVLTAIDAAACVAEGALVAAASS